jgi:hypothetical protein
MLVTVFIQNEKSIKMETCGDLAHLYNVREEVEKQIKELHKDTSMKRCPRQLITWAD